MQWLHSYCLYGLFICYVEAVKVKDIHIFILAHNFLNIQLIFNPIKVWKAETWSFPTIPSNAVYVEAFEASHKNF